MIQTLLLKNAVPFLLGMMLGCAMILGVIHFTQQKIELSCPTPQVTTQEVKCPDSQSAFEIEKMKGFKGTIEVHQHYEVKLDKDSLLIRRLINQIMNEEGSDKKRRRK